jgi:hypothetical protein
MHARLPALFLAATLVVGCNDEPSANEDAGADVPTADTVSDTGESDVITIDDIRIVACDKEDGLAPNQDAANAVDASAGLEAEDLYICQDAPDWFRVDGTTGQTLSVTVDFANRVGDLDLYLVTADALDLDEAIAESSGEDDVESFSTVLPADGTYYVVVEGWEGAVGVYDIEIVPSCSADVDCPAGYACSFIEQACVEVFDPICGIDDNEPNDFPATATVVEVADDGFAFLHGFQVCEEDDDYYLLELVETSSIAIELLFADGFDLDLYVFSPDGALLGAADSNEANPENFDWDYAPAGVYILGVDHFVTQLGNDIIYNLTIEVQPGTCATNADCAQTGRSLCDEGACVPFVVAPPNDAGGLCDDDSDCLGDLDCYEGSVGLDDNFCTSGCRGDGDCSMFANGQCIGNRNGTCFDACETDFDCPRLYACVDDGRCDLVECGLDGDCAEGQRCLRSEQQNRGLCTSVPVPTCSEDDELEANDTQAEASPIDSDYDGLICDGNDDWFAVEVDEDGTRLNVSVEFGEGADIDVYIFDAAGNTVGAAADGEANPERAEAPYLAAGTYAVRINQFPGQRDQITEYSLAISSESAGCTVEGEECLDVVPLRTICSEESGACVQLEGDGAVELGGVCDSADDCTEDAEFCWVFEPASAGNNICTHRCSGQGDCDDVTDTSCSSFGGGFAACLPNP